MKRKASRAAPYERPTKLSKRSTTTTVSRNLSTLRRSSTTTATSSSSVRKPVAPPKWPSIKKNRKAPPPPPPVHRGPPPPSAVPAALPMPNWPTLVPTSKTAARKKGPAAASVPAAAVVSTEDVREVSEEPSVSVPPGLRRMSTLPLAEEEEEKEKKKNAENPEELSSRKGSASTRKSTGGRSALMKTASSLKVAATLEKKGSVVTLDTSGSVTTVSRLPSGSSIGETTSLSAAPPSIRKELSAKAAKAGKGAPAASAKKLSSVRRVTGEDYAAEEPPTSLSSRSSSSAKPAAAATAGGSRTPGGSFKKAASFVPSPSTATTSAVPQALPLPLPPGGLIEIAFSFDTTGSMSSCIAEVRGRVGDMIQRLQADIPGIRIAVIAHGDYCDERTYVIKWIDFGASLPELTDFVQTIGPTGGGDADECYELVLARAQTELSWTPGSQRSLVMIGDANPHPPSYYVARDEKLDWKEEAGKLADMGVRIYAVQALNRSESTNFYRTLAQVTRGLHLKLDQFNNIFDIIMAVCYNEKGVEFVQAYEEEVRAREGGVTLHKDLEGVFSAFKRGKAGTSLVALPTMGKGATKLPAKGAALKRKAVAPAMGKAATTTAKRKPAKAGATPKGKATAAKVETKAPKAKVKAAEATKAAKAGGKGGKGVKGSKPAKTTGKKKTVAATTNKAKVKAAAKKARGKGVKAVKGRKPAKAKAAKKTTASTSKSRKSKKPAPGVKRKFREAVKDEELSEGSCLRKIQWTPWYKAIIPLQPSPKGRQACHFKRRSPAAGTGRTATSASGARPLRRSGLRHIHLLRDRRQNAPAVYEIAVKPRPSAKRYVVFFKACSSWRRKVVWDTVLLNSGGLHEEVNAVLGAGGQIWLRRGNVKDLEALGEAKSHISKCYDYAWQYRGGRGGLGGARGHRRVKRCSALISGNS